MQVREFQRLKDQVVVVTGAAQGLGEAVICCVIATAVTVPLLHYLESRKNK